MQALTFRHAELGDIRAIVALVNSGYRGEDSRAGWTTEADYLDGVRTDEREVRELIGDSRSIFLLCERGSEIVGSVLLQREEAAAYLGMLVVRPTLQGQGIGKDLLDAAEHSVIELWAVGVMRMTVITRREELIAFYERRGYRRTGIFKPFPHHDLRSSALRGELKFEVLEKRLSR